MWNVFEQDVQHKEGDERAEKVRKKKGSVMLPDCGNSSIPNMGSPNLLTCARNFRKPYCHCPGKILIPFAHIEWFWGGLIYNCFQTKKHLDWQRQ